MADIGFFDAFDFKWAENGQTDVYDDGEYKLGWSFIGNTPPTVEQFNELQQLTDEKINWLFTQLNGAAMARGITPSAGSTTVLSEVLSGMLAIQGSFDASTGSYPISPSKGDWYRVSVAGTVSGRDLKVDDKIYYDGAAWQWIPFSAVIDIDPYKLILSNGVLMLEEQ